MNTHVSPAVLGKLEDFRSRRQRLILLRGLCAGLVSTMVAMILIAIVDWWFFLSPPARWGLSVTAYTVVVAMIWFTSVRLIWKMPNSSQLARLLETAEPSLREDLVSAVELGDPSSANPWDSVAFRRFLQENIAHKMGGVNVRSLLPWQLIGRWISFASVAGILFLILLCMPGLHFGRRIARAMLPIANVERVSLTKIEIVSPNPANTTVAQGEEIEVVVRISGPDQNDHVMLETIREGGETSRVEMALVPDGKRSFKSVVRMGHESIQYRVWANDARTSEHILLSRQRPQVISFQKTFRYPDYLQRESKTETDKAGDLVAVDGTEVDLVVEVNQPVTLAHLTVNTGNAEQTVPLTPNIDAEGKLVNRVHGTLALTRTGTYSIRLIGAETGLENKFNPEYVIQAIPDVPPTVRIEQPSPAILVPSDEIVTLQALAEDDWGLASIEQHVRIADGEWTTTSIDEAEAAVSKKQIEHGWDLYPLELEPGSVVFTKLVAVDRKGSRGESRMVRAVISSHGFDPNRWVGLGEARQAHGELMELLSAAQQLKEATLAASDAQSVVTAIARADTCDAQASASLTRVHSALALAETGQASMDLVQVGQAISQASTVGVGFVRNHLAAGSFDEAGKAAEFVETRVKTAADSFDHLLRLSENAAISSDLISLRKIYRDAVDRADPAASERIARRVYAIGSEAGVMADFVTAMREHADDGVKMELQSVEDDFRLLKKLGDPFAGPIGIDAVRSAREPLESALSTSMSLFRRGLLQSLPPRRQLITAAGTTDAPTQRAARFARQLHDMKAALGQQAARGQLDRLQQDAEQTKRTRELSTASFDAAVAGLMTLAALEKSRTDSDSRFVADTSRAWRAMKTIRIKTSKGGAAETQAIDDLDRLASAVRVLNLTHQIDDLIRLVSQIHAGDSASENASSILLNPNRWFAAESQCQSLLGRLKQSAVSPQATELLDDSLRHDAYQLIRKEMSARPQLDRNIEPRRAGLTELLCDLRRVRALLQQPLDEAREVFQQLSPRIDQLLVDLAREVREDADQLNAWLEQGEIDENELADEANQQLDETKQLADQLEQVREALREDASEQNVLDEQGRERMRDDDDALAMIDDQPTEINDALQRAIEEDDLAEQQAALAEAARQQAELAERLEQLAEHFQNLEQEDAEASRQALRESEAALGVRDQLEAQHQQLEQLAQLAELPPAQALAALEQELENNRPMQRELYALTREQLEQTQEQLAATAQQQQRRADSVARQSDQTESLRQWSEQLSRIGQDAEGLNANQVAQAQDAVQAEQEQAAANPFDQRDRAAGEPDARSDTLSEQADAIEAAQQQLAEAAQQSQAPSGRQPSVDELAEAAEQVAQSLRQAADQLQQASRTSRQPSANNADPPSDNADPSNQPSPEAGQLFQQAADAANQLAEQAEQLARALDDAADVWEDEAVEQDPSDVWEDVEQQRIAEAIAEAQQDLQQAARNQQRLGNQENAQQLQQIAEEAQQANQLIEENRQQAVENSTAPNESLGPSQPLGQLSDQLEEVQQAISEPAELLGDFLAGEDPAAAGDEVDEFGANDFEPGNDPAAGELGAEPSTEFGSDSGSEPASESGQPSSETGQPGGETGQPGSESPANESSPALSQTAARQLAQALNSLDRQLLGQPSQQIAYGAGRGSESAVENSPEQSRQASESASATSQPTNPSSSGSSGVSAESAQGSSESAVGPPSASPGSHNAASQLPPRSQSESGGRADANGPPTSSPIAEAIAAAARAQSQPISSGRSSREQPSSSPVGQGYAEISGGAGVEGGPTAIGALPPIGQMKSADWAKLPPKLARELLDGRREKVSPQYRQAVETYFRLVAEKAREN